MQVRDVILYFSLKYQGDWDKIYDAIKNLNQVNDNEFASMKQGLKCEYVTIVDNQYPQILKAIAKPPYVLYYYGNLDLVNCQNILAVVGSRESCSYSLNATKSILQGLNGEPTVIISGLARGIDTLAHQVALENNIPTIAVLGTGIDYCYPKENYQLYDQIKQKGLILSEYPNKTYVSNEAFSFRNRVITGLSAFIFAPDVHDRSGTMVSIKFGLSQGKDIFTLPYSIFEDNMTNRLIQEGAKLIITSNDIVEEFK